MVLRIREEQMEVFREEVRRIRTDRLVAHLREAFPEDTAEASDEEVREFVSVQIDRAAGYGIEKKADVFVYVDRAAFYGEGWDEDLVWAKRILSDDRLSGAAKIEEIRQYEATEAE